MAYQVLRSSVLIRKLVFFEYKGISEPFRPILVDFSKYGSQIYGKNEVGRKSECRLLDLRCAECCHYPVSVLVLRCEPLENLLLSRSSVACARAAKPCNGVSPPLTAYYS